VGHFRRLIVVMVMLCAAVAGAEPAKPDVTLTAHASTVLALAFSPDGKQLASVGDDGNLKIWDLAANKELFTLPNFHTNRNQVRFTPDGKLVISLSDDNTIAVIDTQTGKPNKPISLPGDAGGANAMDLSSDGKLLALVGRGWLRLIDVSIGTEKSKLDVHAGYSTNSVVFCGEGKRILVGGSDHTISLLDLADGHELSNFKTDGDADAIAMSPDGTKVYAACTERVLLSFDLATGKSDRIIHPGTPVLSLAVASKSKQLFIGGPGQPPDRGPLIVNTETDAQADSDYSSDDWVKIVAVSADGKWIAGGSNQGSVYLWKNRK
jgi:WD40 repeat protein